jgi:hypothetical protein
VCAELERPAGLLGRSGRVSGKQAGFDGADRTTPTAGRRAVRALSPAARGATEPRPCLGEVAGHERSQARSVGGIPDAGQLPLARIVVSGLAEAALAVSVALRLARDRRRPIGHGREYHV